MAIPRVGDLRVVRMLGQGGMGAVFLAVDATGRGPFALKVIAAAHAPAPGTRARFEREIAAASAVHHPNVVRVVSAGDASGVPFALFEYIHGRSLAGIGAVPWPAVVDVGRQLADALAAVHAASWIHRDVKPSNVMVTRTGRVTLIDFGLAEPAHAVAAAAPPGGAPSSSLSGPSSVTPAGSPRAAVVGTPRYLAPELLDGGPPTAATDVFSLGLALCELLGDEPCRRAPARVLEVLASAVARDPAARPSAAALAGALERLPSAPCPMPAIPGDGNPTWSLDADRLLTWTERSAAPRPAP